MLRSPNLTKINAILFFIIMVSIILYFGREFFVLIVFSGFFAMVMTPLANKLESRKIPRFLSSLICVIFLIISAFLVIWLLSSQIVSLVSEIPKIATKIQDIVWNIEQWLSAQFGVNLSDQAGSLKENAGAISKAGSYLAGFIRGLVEFTGRFLLIVIFTFLLLFQREKYENFIIMLHRPEKRKDAGDVLSTVSRIAYHYLIGRLEAVFIIAILFVIGFLIIGLKNSILIAAITALLAIVPYIGPLIGGLLPFFIAFVEDSFSQAIEVVIVVLIINMLDHYFIEPYIVGGSVNISPLFTILALVAGGVLWGIAGVILFLPLTGILKIIFDNVEGLHPYAYLIGNGEKGGAAHGRLFKGIIRIFRRKKGK